MATMASSDDARMAALSSASRWAVSSVGARSSMASCRQSIRQSSQWPQSRVDSAASNSVWEFAIVPPVTSRDELGALLKKAAAAMKGDLKGGRRDPRAGLPPGDRPAATPRTRRSSPRSWRRAWARRKSAARSLYYARKSTKLAPMHKATWTTLAKTCELARIAPARARGDAARSRSRPLPRVRARLQEGGRRCRRTPRTSAGSSSWQATRPSRARAEARARQSRRDGGSDRGDRGGDERGGRHDAPRAGVERAGHLPDAASGARRGDAHARNGARGERRDPTCAWRSRERRPTGTWGSCA